MGNAMEKRLWGEKRYYSFDYYCKNRFGRKVYKLSLEGGVTCPNRDGTVGTKGCIFCSEGGSGDFCPSGTLPIVEQLEEAKKRIEAKLPSPKSCEDKAKSKNAYFAYFQSYTSTYLPLERLREKLYCVRDRSDILGIFIGTRPDCLPQEVLEVIAEVNEIKPVFIELGLQTIHEDTARFIRRGYPLQTFEKAVYELTELGIPVVIHTILGLPGEGRKEVLETVEYINRLDERLRKYAHEKSVLYNPLGIKLQLLHILRETELCTLYEQDEGIFTLSFEEYIDLLLDCVAHLRPEIIIHRLTGDGPKKLLVAPLWSGDKKRVLNTISKEMKRRDIWQGCVTQLPLGDYSSDQDKRGL